MGAPVKQKQNQKKSASQLVVEYGANHLRRVVGKGECWDLPFEALKYAKALTPRDIRGGTYVWGESVLFLKDAKPGDILQFANVRIKRTWVTGDGVKHTEAFNMGQRHSAIVEKVDKDLFFTTLNAHVKRSRRVQRLRMNLSPENIQSGTIYLYRPIAK